MVEPLTFTYTNWRGETSERRAMPIDLQFRSTKWHPEPQWLLVANDLDKGETRMFAIKDMRFPSAAPAMVETTATTDAELVERLEASYAGSNIPWKEDVRLAASRIVALSAEVERLTKAHGTCHGMDGDRCIWADRAEDAEARALAAERQRDDLKAALEKAHEVMHKLTAILPGNDRAYAETVETMAEIRATLARLPSEPVPSPSGEEERKALEANAETVANWLASIAELDFDEIAADGGVTSGMVIQQEARHMAARLRTNLSRLQEPR